MKLFMINSLKKTFIMLIFGTVSAFLTLIVAYILHVNNQHDLDSWHTTILKNEFTADTSLKNLNEYRQLEEKLFTELNQRIIDPLPANKKTQISRFTPESLSNPTRWQQNWNKTYEFKTNNASAGVLMLHGLSDSPYSLRHMAKNLHKAGAWVVGLRVPGHGTIPSGLVTVQWQDMAAAVQLAVKDLHEKLGDKPITIVGYSNGAALAVHYALTALNDGNLPQPHRLILLSPAIGVTPMAAFAVWQARLGNLFGMDKLAWQDVLPEYDPFKYQSFAINAGDLEYRLTNEIQNLLTQLESGNKLEHFPPTLAFMSAIDATVSTHAVVRNFFLRLPPNQHELIVFDLNRYENMLHLFTEDPRDDIEKLLHYKSLPFSFSVVGNRDINSREVAIRTNPGNNAAMIETNLDMAWPKGIYSLSHVAMPFSPQDPLYGRLEASRSPGISIGNITLRGEKGALYIPAKDMLRQRWNPFYTLIENRTERVIINNH